jgi:hypothetical protein
VLGHSLSDGDESLTHGSPDALGGAGLTTIGLSLGSVLHLVETICVYVPGRVDEISIHDLLLERLD